jgi:Putative metallopeptidase
MSAGWMLVALGLAAPLATPAAAPTAAPGFHVQYRAPHNADYATYRDELKRERFLESVTADLDATLKLPAPLTVELAECGHSTASHSDTAHSVTVCYELIDALVAIAQSDRPAPERAQARFSGALTYVLLAEIGAALVSEYALSLPLDSSSAQAGTEFAALSLASAERDAEPIGAGALELFTLALANRNSGFEYPADHGLDRVRLEDMACILYGNAPGNHASVVSGGLLPEARAPHCAEEVVELAKRWDGYLKPHARPGATPAAAAP